MKINRRTIEFDKCDAHFVEKFGVSEASEMVRCFTEMQKAHPFIYDSYQLAALLGVSRKKIFNAARRADKLYNVIIIKKKNGSDRIIYAPAPELKYIQRRILNTVLQSYTVSPSATAYRKGAKPARNAEPHCGKRYLLKLDIKDFFSSITSETVYNTVFNTNYFPANIGMTLTSLCCRKNILAQGAPTSPAISNIVMKHFDSVMNAWCAERDIAFTRYSDDIVFSSDRPLYGAFTKAKSLLISMGFELNAEKTHFITNASKQIVTGLVVNDKPSVPNDYRRELRQELYYALKYGAADAIMREGRNEFIKDGVPQVSKYLDSLYGKISYILSITPDDKYFYDARKKILNLRDDC